MNFSDNLNFSSRALFRAVDVSTDILKVCEKKNLIRMEFIARLVGDRASGMTWEKSDSMVMQLGNKNVPPKNIFSQAFLTNCLYLVGR